MRGRRGRPVLVLRLAGRRPRRAARAAADAELADRIRTIHEADRTQGAPRITAELNDGAPPRARVNHKRVARVMRAHAIAGLRLRRRVRTTIPEPADQKVPDLLRRDFTAPAPNQRYVGDITYLPIADGSNLYLATVIDCFSRRLAGWAIAEHMRTDLVTDALAAARTRGDRWPGRSSTPTTEPSSTARRPSPSSARAARGDPVDGRGRYQRRQRARGVVQRLAQARDAAGRARLARPSDVSAGGVRLGEPLQHRSSDGWRCAALFSSHRQVEAVAGNHHRRPGKP